MTSSLTASPLLSPVPLTAAESAARIAALYACGDHDVRPALDIRVVDETGSTNADLMAALPALRGPTLLMARSQTAGRGRAGRPWLTEPDSALTFSLAWRFDLPMQGLTGLPLAVGVSLADALALQGVAVRLKWPNDVLLDGAKLAGMLIETATVKGAASQVWAVIGIGLNLAVSSALSARIGRTVTSAPVLRTMAREDLMAALLRQLTGDLSQFEAGGFGAFAQRWNGLHAYAGMAVDILDQGRALHSGVAQGVDRSGRLLLATADGQAAIVAGDVSLRLQGGG